MPNKAAVPAQLLFYHEIGTLVVCNHMTGGSKTYSQYDDSAARMRAILSLISFPMVLKSIVNIP
jgi:hypothetical protein